MYKTIEIGHGVSVSGSSGEFVLLEVPEHIYQTEDYAYEPTILQWVNTMAKLGLDFHGLDYRGSGFFRIK